MKLKGSELHRDDKKHVLAAYCHRFTGEHRPNWVRLKMDSECGPVLKKQYPIQFENDSEWLENTLFTVKKNNRLDMRVKRCVSTPTWPNNPELRK